MEEVAKIWKNGADEIKFNTYTFNTKLKPSKKKKAVKRAVKKVIKKKK